MRPLKIALLVLGCLFLAACAQDKTTVKEHKVIEVPDGSKSKTIDLGRVVIKVPRGQVIGQVKAGFACFVIGQTTWTGGSKGSGNSELTSIFFEELKRNNYRVVGDPTDLFSKPASGEITVAGLVTSIAKDTCYPDANAYYINKMWGTTKASLTVEWQVYSNMQKKVILKSTSTGEAERKFTDGNPEEAVYLAFSSAVQGLLADQQFYDTVVEKEKPKGNFGELGATTTDSSSGTYASAPAGASLSVPANAKQTRSMLEVQQAVVVLEMGGHGSGVLIGDEGYILTNHHVVEGYERLRAIFNNGQTKEATVVKSDPRQDVALVKIDSPPVKGLPLHLEDLAPGTEVLAVGAPLGTENIGTITKGIVSGYRFKEDGSRWIQSNTMVTKGNSGGPLVDTQGRVVGLTSFGRTDYSALSYFVPIADGLRALGMQTR